MRHNQKTLIRVRSLTCTIGLPRIPDTVVPGSVRRCLPAALAVNSRSLHRTWIACNTRPQILPLLPYPLPASVAAERFEPGRSFAFRSRNEAPAGVAAKCLLCGPRHSPMLRRSAMVAAVVGTILTFLNQGDTLISGDWNNALYWKIPLTYCVPFLVATYGALAAARR